MDKKKDIDQLYYFGYFKKLYESWEESTNVMMDIWLNSPYMERAMDKSHEFKDYVQNFMQDSIENRCKPKNKGKGEKENLVEYIDKLEEKIKNLEQKLEELESTPKKKASSSRKKKGVGQTPKETK